MLKIGQKSCLLSLLHLKCEVGNDKNPAGPISALHYDQGNKEVSFLILTDTSCTTPREQERDPNRHYSCTTPREKEILTDTINVLPPGNKRDPNRHYSCTTPREQERDPNRHY